VKWNIKPFITLYVSRKTKEEHPMSEHKLEVTLENVKVTIEIDAETAEAAAEEAKKLDAAEIIEDGDVTSGTVKDVSIIDE